MTQRKNTTGRCYIWIQLIGMICFFCKVVWELRVNPEERKKRNKGGVQWMTVALTAAWVCVNCGL